MAQAKGVVPAMLTVWGADERYDARASERYVDWLLDSGAQGLVVAGSTGENTAMLHDEQKAVIEHVVRYVDGQVPVYAGTGKYTTLETLELTRHAEAVGADGVMVILPYYFRPYVAAAMDHLRAVHRATALPVVLYNNPNFAGYELDTAQVKELNDEGVISGVKVAQGDPERVSSIKLACGDRIRAYYGHDYAAFHGLAAGADGWLSGFPAAFPRQCRELVDALAVEHDLDKGREVWERFVPFVDFFMDPAVNAQVHWLEMLKWAVTVQGVPVGIPRRPLKELDPAMRTRLERVLAVLLG